MALRSEAIGIIIQYCPPHIPLRAASAEMLKLTELSEPFMKYFGDQLMKQKRYQGPVSAPHQLSRAVRIGHSSLVILLMRFNTDPHIPVTWLGTDSDDDEIVVEETPFETAMRTGNWDAVVAFAARSSPPCSLKSFRKDLPRLFPACQEEWNRFNKEWRAYFQRAKDEWNHKREKDRRLKQDLRRSKEDGTYEAWKMRRGKEDARRARYDSRITHRRVTWQQQEVEVSAENDAKYEDEEQPEQKDLFAEDENETDTDNLVAAIRASRADLPVLSDDSVVLLRIRRRARSPLTMKVLLESPLLLHCRVRVLDAGCEIAPQGVCGSKFFVPCTESQFEELKEAGFELLDHHILALRGDKALINKAFKDALPKKHRTKVFS